MTPNTAELGRSLAQARHWVLRNVPLWPTLGQLAIVLACLAIGLFARPALTRAVERRRDATHFVPFRLLLAALARVAGWLVTLVLLALAETALAQTAPSGRHGLGHDRLLRLATSLVFAWVAIRFSSLLVRNPSLARTIAVVAWALAALNIAGLLAPAAGLLDGIAVTIGTLRVSVLLVLKGALLLVALLWLANLVSRFAEARLAAMRDLSPSLQVLAAKLLRIALLTLAVVVALGAVGIDLTAFAVFSGAIGVGLGFGLQKVVSNLVSGVILLLDRSIKPGDVIEIDGTYGWITRLNARFVSVVTRDGTEYLIPNEDLITQRVTNWSYSNDLVRLHVPFGISYESNLRDAIRLALAAIEGLPRILPEPQPICLVTGFGDSAVDLEIRFWISDPRAGTENVKSDILLAIWDSFRANGIELPFPQRDLHLRNPEALRDLLDPEPRTATPAPPAGRTP